MNYVWLIPIAAGLFIELFFRLIRYRDRGSLSGPVPKYRPYNNYVSVSEYVTGGKKRWWRYILFRALPPFIVLILTAAVYQKYFSWLSITFPVLISAFLSLLPRDIYQLFKRDISVSEKTVHVMNIIVVAFAAALAILCSNLFMLSVLAPSIHGMIDNLWSALFVSVLIVFYLDTTNQTNDTIVTEKINQHDDYVVGAFNKIDQKFGKIILESCRSSNCSVPLLFSVLIYENMNRPLFARKIENLIVSLTHNELTVGIAQVKSKVSLTDEQSIVLASIKLKNTAKLVHRSFTNVADDYLLLEKRLETYNGSGAYAEPIIQILSTLNTYAHKRLFS